ncbi:hypothetical protein N9436_00260 [bacterium]|nr:hypothetical protein [bacterium]MDB3997216.1 hypothetical protein [bacterium]
MSNIWNIIKDIVSELTSVLIGVLGLGVVAGLAYGEPVLGLDVVGGITSLVSDLASMGVVGLLVLAILMALLSKHVD